MAGLDIIEQVHVLAKQRGVRPNRIVGEALTNYLAHPPLEEPVMSARSLIGIIKYPAHLAVKARQKLDIAIPPGPQNDWRALRPERAKAGCRGANGLKLGGISGSWAFSTSLIASPVSFDRSRAQVDPPEQ